eukprot:symbB.v1.2.024534.t1/scaffold2327.1/size82221/5
MVALKKDGGFKKAYKFAKLAENGWLLFPFEAEPLNACSDLQLPPNREQTLEEAYAGRLVLISRGGCLFVQKLLRAQQAGAAGVIMINSETYDERLQVMTCPNQERGGGSEVRIPAAMISWNDGQQLLQKLHGSARGGGKRLILRFRTVYHLFAAMRKRVTEEEEEQADPMLNPDEDDEYEDYVPIKKRKAAMKEKLVSDRPGSIG